MQTAYKTQEIYNEIYNDVHWCCCLLVIIRYIKYFSIM